ncbi:YdcF family protein [Acinetobacter nectaris]|uniref:YdcF family protein n=1 Tax=Acinetobacter nectaris TaxID=1219382 RepID=UPI001F38E4D5|nr:YdcF family protein [Acinetobacter nectaris]MCF8999531.1 YdcF family protein [Acinetobacter nectaris]MCF9028059.1 YdcF family protein [Acinetobacter nectaris]
MKILKKSPYFLFNQVPLMLAGIILVSMNSYLLSLQKRDLSTLVPLILGILFILLSIVWQPIQSFLAKHPLAKKAWRLAWLFFFVWLITLGIFFWKIQQNVWATKHVPPVDNIMVLGCGTINGKPSPTLQQRLDRAAAIAQQQPNTHIILTGGYTTDPDFSEAQIMAEYLKQNYHIANDRMLLENESTSTFTNFKNSAVVMEKYHITKEMPLAVVTSEFHVPRSKAIGEKQGYSHIYMVSALTPLLTRYNLWFREYFATLHAKLLKEF